MPTIPFSLCATFFYCPSSWITYDSIPLCLWVEFLLWAEASPSSWLGGFYFSCYNTLQNFSYALIFKPSLLSTGAYLVLSSSIHDFIKTYYFHMCLCFLVFILVWYFKSQANLLTWPCNSFGFASRNYIIMEGLDDRNCTILTRNSALISRTTQSWMESHH